jgi:Family of unknown function (DUF6275)
MTADVAATPVPATTELPKPAPPQPQAKRQSIDPDLYIRTAKQMAVKNFNESRDVSRSKELRVDQVYIVSFAKVMGHWKATVGSPVARTLLWDVTFHAGKNAAYVIAYKKVNEITYPLGEPTA